ncbi:hypothetical protein CRG98_014574 [Punica granatum]|nr:hypothetical protein CRG98_014574 [Punica granatum]
MASRAPKSGKADHRRSTPGKSIRPMRALRSLAVSLMIPFSLNAAMIFLFGSGKRYEEFPDKTLWVPPLWLIHSASLGSSLLMGLASWLVWARGGLHLVSDALPLYVAQVSLGIVWDPLVLVIGSCWVGFVFCIINFGTLVACKSSFQKVNQLAGDIANICAMWAAFLTFVTLQLSFL